MRCKKMIAVLSALTLLTGSLAAYPASAAAKGSGDIDENGSVQIADAILLARWIAEDTEISVSTQGLLNADMNGDEAVDSDDAASLLSWLAGTETAPPAEGRSVDLLAGLTAGDVQTAVPDEAFCAAQADFTANLFRTVAANEEDTDKNLLVSPLSVSLALGMTMNGAKGVTLAEMQKVLGGDLTAEQLNAYYAAWSKALQEPQEITYISNGMEYTGDPEEDAITDMFRYAENDRHGWQTPSGADKMVTEQSQPVTITNAVWFKDDEKMIKVPQQFLQTISDYYGAGAFKAPMDDSTVDDINGWVSENTHGMIDSLMQKPMPDALVMVLVNALTFESLWETTYASFEVGDGKFTAANGEIRDVRMMRGEERGYLDDGKATGFVKAYKDDRYSFAAVLPNEGTSVDEYIAGLDGKALQKLFGSRQSVKVRSSMPKFKFDYNVRLKDVLEALGMPTAFGDGETAADFTGLNEAPNAFTRISEVLHKTFIDVSETGTKAAAVTAVMMANGTAMEDEPKQVVLDRPFLFMILDNQTNLPIFIGAVRDIGAEQ